MKSTNSKFQPIGRTIMYAIRKLQGQRGVSLLSLKRYLRHEKDIDVVARNEEIKLFLKKNLDKGILAKEERNYKVNERRLRRKSKSPSKGTKIAGKRTKSSSKGARTAGKRIKGPSEKARTTGKGIKSPSKKIRAAGKEIKSPSKGVRTAGKTRTSSKKKTESTEDRKTGRKRDDFKEVSNRRFSGKKKEVAEEERKASEPQLHYFV